MDILTYDISIYRFVQDVTDQPECLACFQSSWNDAVVAQRVMLLSSHCSKSWAPVTVCMDFCMFSAYLSWFSGGSYKGFLSLSDKWLENRPQAVAEKGCVRDGLEIQPDPEVSALYVHSELCFLESKCFQLPTSIPRRSLLLYSHTVYETVRYKTNVVRFKARLHHGDEFRVWAFIRTEKCVETDISFTFWKRRKSKFWPNYCLLSEGLAGMQLQKPLPVLDMIGRWPEPFEKAISEHLDQVLYSSVCRPQTSRRRQELFIPTILFWFRRWGHNLEKARNKSLPHHFLCRIYIFFLAYHTQSTH